MKHIYDVVIIGGGPSGMTSAIYCARGGFDVAIIEKGIYGGALLDTDVVENYTSYESIGGFQLAENMENHVKSISGIEHIYGEVEKLVKSNKGHFTISTKNKKVLAKSVIIATGVKSKSLGVKGEEELKGRGVSMCSVCDGSFFKGKDITVIGGGDSAMESAIYLSKIANEVIVIHRRNKFRAEKILQDRAKEIDNIKYIYNAETISIDGNSGFVSGITYKDKKTHESHIHPTDGVFINVGVVPNTDAFNDLGILRESGFIYTDKNMNTSVEGIFAVGDVRYDSIRQVVTAVGDGAVCSNSVNNYLNNI